MAANTSVSLCCVGSATPSPPKFSVTDDEPSHAPSAPSAKTASPAMAWPPDTLSEIDSSLAVTSAELTSNQT